MQAGEADDAELVRRVRDGNAAAFRQLVDRHGDSLFRLALALLGSRSDAEDVVQETFLGAFRRLDAFQGRSSPKTWLVRILMNQASKLRRSRKLRRMAPLEAAEGPGGGGSMQTGTPTTAVDSRVDVTAMLEALTPEHREVLVLRELQGLSYEEIAEALGVPRGTVESRLHRARNELKRRYAGYLP